MPWIPWIEIIHRHAADVDGIHFHCVAPPGRRVLLGGFNAPGKNHQPIWVQHVAT